MSLGFRSPIPALAFAFGIPSDVVEILDRYAYGGSTDARILNSLNFAKLTHGVATDAQLIGRENFAKLLNGGITDADIMNRQNFSKLIDGDSNDAVIIRVP